MIKSTPYNSIEHKHCIICGIIDSRSSAKGNILCKSCYPRLFPFTDLLDYRRTQIGDYNLTNWRTYPEAKKRLREVHKSSCFLCHKTERIAGARSCRVCSRLHYGIFDILSGEKSSFVEDNPHIPYNGIKYNSSNWFQHPSAEIRTKELGGVIVATSLVLPKEQSIIKPHRTWNLMKQGD